VRERSRGAGSPWKILEDPSPPDAFDFLRENHISDPIKVEFAHAPRKQPAAYSSHSEEDTPYD
jgi:hypothetical protein